MTQFIESAEKWAQERDSLPADKRGPLHGLPIAIKDNFKVMEAAGASFEFMLNPHQY